MPIPMPGHFCKWHHEPEELEAANRLSELQLQKWQTMNVEVAQALAEFQFSVGGDSASLLNTPQYWELRGRRTLILETLQAHDDAIGSSKPPTIEESINPNGAF